jgi:phosphoserine phosphatase RsbU/P
MVDNSDYHDHDLLNTAPCGFLIFSDEGDIIALNDTLLQVLHYEREALIGKKLETILSIANRIFYQTHLFPLLKLHGKAEEVFLSLLSSNKEQVYVLLNATRKLYKGTLSNHCILVPVHQRKKYENELLQAKKSAEEALLKNEKLLEAQQALEQHKQTLDRQVSRLKQLNRELRQFSKVISHDIQEPIRKISIFADIAINEADKRGDKLLISALEKIRRSCQRMSKMVSSLEHYLSLQNAENPVEKVDLNEVVEKARMLAVQSTGLHAELIFEHPTLPVIIAHRKQMELLFFNLIENAIKFRKSDTPLKIQIECTVFQENSYKSLPDNYRYHDVVKLVFADNGRGFNTEHSNNLFQLFQKLQTDTNGIGLGLALCKKIIDNHFGEISLDSKPGEGTSFTMLLPLLN